MDSFWAIDNTGCLGSRWWNEWEKNNAKTSSEDRAIVQVRSLADIWWQETPLGRLRLGEMMAHRKCHLGEGRMLTACRTPKWNTNFRALNVAGFRSQLLRKLMGLSVVQTRRFWDAFSSKKPSKREVALSLWLRRTQPVQGVRCWKPGLQGYRKLWRPPMPSSSIYVWEMEALIFVQNLILHLTI